MDVSLHRMASFNCDVFFLGLHFLSVLGQIQDRGESIVQNQNDEGGNRNSNKDDGKYDWEDRKAVTSVQERPVDFNRSRARPTCMPVSMIVTYAKTTMSQAKLSLKNVL